MTHKKAFRFTTLPKTFSKRCVRINQSKITNNDPKILELIKKNLKKNQSNSRTLTASEDNCLSTYLYVNIQIVS